MLGPVELKMNGSMQFNSCTNALGLMGKSWLTLRKMSTIVLVAGSFAFLQAQNAAPVQPKAQHAPEPLPAAPVAPNAQSEAAVSTFSSYQRQAQPWSRPAFGFDLGFRSSVKPFQPAVNLINPQGSTGNDLTLNPDLNGTGGFGAPRPGVSGFNQPGSFGMKRSEGDPGTLFQPSGLAGGPFGATPQPSLNQLMRGSFNLPMFSPSIAPFRFQYSSALMPGGTLSDLARPSSSVLFTSSDLGNGVFLSAGTYNSGHSMAGAPIVPAGNGSGAPKHSASGVAIKLSF
jgi:hypothetical protein